ncbi:MAG: hypothetical protein R3B74_11255 [Nitrospirales bacterium]|nr:hypothetical protein [Nitrospirales bacterium]
MKIRQKAREWLQREGRLLNEPFKVSKFYTREQSWKRVDSWWFEFEEMLVEDSHEEFLNLLCETFQNSDEFYHLKIPLIFLREHKIHLGFRHDNERYSLILSAEDTNKFRELRGDGQIEFANFLQ